MKNKLRKELIKKRKSLRKTEVLAKSNQIKNRLFESNEFKQASVVLFYVSYGNEVYTHDMIKDCLDNKIQILVPISNKENNTLILSKLKNWDDLEIGSYGILESKKEKINEVLIDCIDLIIVPGLGFDKRGHRIGHGMGYYDKLLKYSVKPTSIGLAFEFQIVKQVPTEKIDVSVDIIVTEKDVFIV